MFHFHGAEENSVSWHSLSSRRKRTGGEHCPEQVLLARLTAHSACLFVYTLVYTLRKQYLWKGMTQERVNLAWQEKQDKGRALAVWPPWRVLSAAHSQWGATTGHATSWGKLCHLDISPVDTILGKWFIKNTRNYTSYLLFHFSDGKIISHLIVSSRPPTGTWGLVYRG